MEPTWAFNQLSVKRGRERRGMSFPLHIGEPARRALAGPSLHCHSPLPASSLVHCQRVAPCLVPWRAQPCPFINFNTSPIPAHTHTQTHPHTRTDTRLFSARLQLKSSSTYAALPALLHASFAANSTLHSSPAASPPYPPCMLHCGSICQGASSAVQPLRQRASL